MSETSVVGQATGGKPINLSQLEAELVVAGVSSGGLGLHDEYVYPYDAEGQPTDFPSADQSTVDQAIADHVAMRDKTDQELAAEFQATSDPARKQDIRDQQAGLVPREQVPM